MILIGWILSLGLDLLLTILAGWFLSICWGWFVVPLGLPAVDTLTAAGVHMAWSGLMQRLPSWQEFDGEDVDEVLRPKCVIKRKTTYCVYYLLVFALCAIVHWMM